VKQDEQEHYSPPRRRVESDGSNREQLSIVNEDEDSFVETNLDASLRSNDMESFVESRVNIKESASSTSTVLLTKSKKSQTKKVGISKWTFLNTINLERIACSNY
jgi:hypothetical protein